MSTPCAIGLQIGDKVKGIYCHNDGYPEHMFDVLKNGYTKQSKVEKLLSLGDLSSIGYNPISKEEFWDTSFYMNHVRELDNYCIAYKDRGDENVDAQEFDSLTDFYDGYDVDYYYIFNNNNWYYRQAWGNKKLKLIEEFKMRSNEQDLEKPIRTDVKSQQAEILTDVEDKNIGVGNVAYSDAVKDVKKAGEMAAKANKVPQAEKHKDKGENPKMVPGAKKMHLDEDLFDIEDGRSDLVRHLTVDIYNDNKIFISEDGASGSEYDGSTPEDISFAVQAYLEDNMLDEAVSPKNINKDTRVKYYYTLMYPDDYQLDLINPDITFDELWGRMQAGEDFYEIASVDGTGFDSAVRENIFSGMSEILDIPYDEIYETWLQND